jgi:OOP family OmpA-OmpF porin
MKIRGKLLAASCLVVAGFAMPSAFAQDMDQGMMNPPPTTGPYVSLGLGTNVMATQHYDYPAIYGESGTTIFRPDYAGELGLGYGLGNGFRVELDGNFFRNNIRKEDGTLSGQQRAYGGVNTYGALANVLYDFQTTLPVRPYVGAGVGYEWQKFEHLRVPGIGATYSGTYGSAAFDIIGGIAYDISSVPGLAVTAQYQYTDLVANRKYLNAPYGTVVQFGKSHGHAGPALRAVPAAGSGRGAGAGARPGCGARAGSGPDLSRVLQLGQGKSDSACDADRIGSGAGLAEHPCDPAQRERLYRYLGQPGLQHEAVLSPRR